MRYGKGMERPRKPRRSVPDRGYVPRCQWCDEPLDPQRSTRAYCSDRCKQAAYRQRKRAERDSAEAVQLKDTIRQQREAIIRLEDQLERAECRADAHIAEANRVFDDRDWWQNHLHVVHESLQAAYDREDRLSEQLAEAQNQVIAVESRRDALTQEERNTIISEVIDGPYVHQAARADGFAEGYRAAVDEESSPEAHQVRQLHVDLALKQLTQSLLELVVDEYLAHPEVLHRRRIPQRLVNQLHSELIQREKDARHQGKQQKALSYEHAWKALQASPHQQP